MTKKVASFSELTDGDD